MEQDGDLTFERELERVGEEIENDLLPVRAIDVDGRAERRAVDHERETGGLDERPEGGSDACRERGQIRRLERHAKAPGFEAREVEQAIDQAKQAYGVPVHGPQTLVSEDGVGAGEGVFDRSEHQRERRAKFVAHVAEEGRLRGVELAELRVRVAQLAVRGGQLLAAADHSTLHIARPITELRSRLGRAHEIRDVLDAVEDVTDIAGPREDGDVLRAPVLRLESAVGAANVVALDRHRVGRSCRDDAIERRTEVARPVGARVVRVVGKDFEERSPERRFTCRMGGSEPRIRRGDHGVARRIWEQDEQNVG